MLSNVFKRRMYVELHSSTNSFFKLTMSTSIVIMSFSYGFVTWVIYTIIRDRYHHVLWGDMCCIHLPHFVPFPPTANPLNIHLLFGNFHPGAGRCLFDWHWLGLRRWATPFPLNQIALHEALLYQDLDIWIKCLVIACLMALCQVYRQ